MRRLIHTAAVGLVCAVALAACARQRPSVHVSQSPARTEARDLSSEIEEAEVTLAAALEAPRCDEACGLADRICALSDRICGLAQRDPDEELEDRCRRAGASCESARERVAAACPTCGDGE